MIPKKSTIPTGVKFTVLKDNPEHPLKSPNTHLCACILACGGRLAREGYADTVGKAPDGSPRRTVVWIFDETEMEFLLSDSTRESISTAEFIRRWQSNEWINTNTDHPICYLKAYQIQLDSLRNHINRNSPLVEVRRGGGVAYIDPNGDPERNRALLSKL